MICTFYSYKGGVGRSMALANVADLLARGGLRVLMVDFDLEAPGLEQFFQVNHERIRRQTGLLDLLLTYKRSMSTAGGAEPAFRNIERFICPMYEGPLPGGGRLDLLPAGQRQDREQLARYALNLRTFDWQDFYFNWEGELFFEWLRRELTPQRYQLVLVDSRTGVTEMGGICGYQLADVIVMMCAANHQNVQGTANMLADFRSPAVEALRGGRPLQVIVVPARVEQRDPVLLKAFFERFDEAFQAHEPSALREAGLSFRELMVPYEPQCAFEEQVVSDPERRQQREHIRQAFTRLANTLNRLCQLRAREFETGQVTRADQPSSLPAAAEVPSPAPTSPACERVEPSPAATQYDAAKRFAGYDVFLDYGRAEAAEAERIVGILRHHGLQVFYDKHDIPPGQDWRQVIEEALFHSRALVCCIGAQALSEWRLQTLELAVNALGHGRALRIVPVLLPGADLTVIRSGPLARFQALSLREGVTEATLRPLVDALAGVAAPRVKVETESRPPYLGLATFEEQHADLWFGREAAVAGLEERLARDHCVLLCGPGGSGKTSLVRAGLVPRLRAKESGDRRFHFAPVRLDSQPRSNLRRALGQLRAEAPVGLTDQSSVRDWVAWARGPEGRTPRRVLLFIDQFEELFTAAVEEPERQAFLSEVEQELVPALCGELELVVALRSDGLPELTRFGGPSACLQAHRIDLGPLTQDALRRAIEQPAERVGLAFEPGLVERILADLGGEVGSLGLLQIVLWQLWEHRRAGWLTNADYDSIGGAAGALERLAEGFYGGLAPPGQAAMRWLMLQMVQVGDRTTRRRVPADVLVPVEVADSAEGRSVYQTTLRGLCAEGLATVTEEQGRVVYELTHEALMRWDRLRSWIAEDRQFQQWRQSLELRYQQWREGKGELLDGSALEVALAARRDRAATLTADEREFIDASDDARRRRRRRQRSLALTVATMALLGVVLVVWLVQHAAAVNRRAELARQVTELLATGDALAADGRSQGALSNYTAALALDPLNPDLLLRRGRALLESGQATPAANDFTAALTLETNIDRQAEARLGLGQARLSLGQVGAALDDYDQATRLVPTNAAVWLARGNAGLKAHSLTNIPATLDLARTSYDRALQLNPKLAEARLGRASAYLEIGQTNAATNDLQQVVLLDTADVRLREAAAARLRQLGARTTPTENLTPATRLVVYTSSAADQAQVREMAGSLPKSMRLEDVRSAPGGSAIGQVLYFYPQDEDRAKEALYLFESELAKRGAAVRLRVIYRVGKEPIRREAKEAQPGWIEVWLPSLTAPSLAPFEQRTLNKRAMKY